VKTKLKLVVAFAILCALLVLTGWLLFPRYMAYKERASIEPGIKEIRLATHRDDVEKVFGPHALWSSTTDAAGHNMRVLLRAKRYQWYCVIERWKPSSMDPAAPYEPLFVRVYRLQPPPRNYRLQTEWGRQTMERYSRAYGKSERHPIYQDPYVLDFLAATTGGATGKLAIKYELIHEDARQQPGEADR